jgi:SAM-dependent methyltransferase
MRANRDRTAGLAFGQLVDHYDAGRLALPPEFVGQTLARLGIPASGAGSPRLEVGAGTGQLTAALLADDARVVAVEPSAPTAERLRQNLAASLAAGRLSVRCQSFESLDPAEFEPFSQIWSADAWHWVDPLVGYPLAARLLRPEGVLICTWSYPLLTDHERQRRLNQVYVRLAPDLVRDPDSHLAELEPLLAEGRAEVTGSDLMSIADYWSQSAEVSVTADQYADFQLSFANIASMAPAQQAELSAAILDVLGAGGPPGVSLTTWRYTVASRPGKPGKT